MHKLVKIQCYTEKYGEGGDQLPFLHGAIRNAFKRKIEFVLGLDR